MTCERAVQFPASAEPSVARKSHFVSGCVLRRAMVSPPTWNSVTGSVAKSTVKLPQGPVPSAEFGILALLVLFCFVRVYVWIAVAFVWRGTCSGKLLDGLRMLFVE